MRIHVALATILMLTLPGCQQRTAEDIRNAAGGTNLPTPGPRPGGTQLTDADHDRTFRQNYRELNIRTCLGTAQRDSARGAGPPAGTDFRPYCTCFIDRSMAGLSAEQLVRLEPGARERGIAEQCAREHLLAQAGGDGGGDSGGK